jgi:hypothetical protein
MAQPDDARGVREDRTRKIVVLPALVACLASGGAASGGCVGSSFTAAAEAGGDASVVDAGSIVDSPADRGADADAHGEAALPFCAANSGHTFCEDFDEDGVPGKFTVMTMSGAAVGNGPKVVADTTLFFSAPESALAETPALAKAGDFADALLVATMKSTKSSSSPSQVTLQTEFSLGLGCLNADGVAFVALSFALSNAAAPGSYSVGVTATATASNLVEFTSGTDGGLNAGTSHPFGSLPVDPNWFLLTLTLDLSAQTATVSVGNSVALNEVKLMDAPPASMLDSTAMLDVGAQIKDLSAVSAGCRVHIDNVLVDLLP